MKKCYFGAFTIWPHPIGENACTENLSALLTSLLLPAPSIQLFDSVSFTPTNSTPATAPHLVTPYSPKPRQKDEKKWSWQHGSKDRVKFFSKRIIKPKKRTLLLFFAALNFSYSLLCSAFASWLHLSCAGMLGLHEQAHSHPQKNFGLHALPPALPRRGVRERQWEWVSTATAHKSCQYDTYACKNSTYSTMLAS